MSKKLLFFLLFLILNNTVVKGDIIQDSKLWKFFSGIANDAKTNFPEIPFLKSETTVGTLNFGTAIYQGDIKKGKAHGYGVFKFSDGTQYKGTFKRNMFHGSGVYLDKEGNLIKGKWKYNKLSNPINNNTREIVQLNKAFGKVNYFEIRGEGELRSKWFEAEISKENTAEVQLIKELDIFDTPSVFSKDYGDQDKIKELIDEKNLEIIKQNEISANISSNMQTTYVLTAKGKKDMEDQKQDLMMAHEKATVASGSHGGMSGGGGGGC